MSPERTSHATSLPVRADRPARADAKAPDDTFATLLGAHADRPERAAARDRGSVHERTDRPDARRDRGPVHGRPDSPDAQGRRPPARGDDRDVTNARPDEDAASAAAQDAAAAMVALFPPALGAPQSAVAPLAPTAGASGAPAQPAAPTAAATAELTGALQDAGSGLNAVTRAQAAADLTAQVTAADAGAQTGAPADAPEPPAPAADAAAQSGAAAADADTSAQGAGTRELPKPPSSTNAPDGPTRAPTDATASAGQTQQRPTGEGATGQGYGRPAGHQSAVQNAPVAQAQPSAQAASGDLPPVAAPTAAPAQPVASGQGAASLSQAPRAVGQLIHLATQSGIQRARLNLRPAELGGIEIRLQSSAAGISAQLVADSPHAARLLQQASDDLRRSLAAQDVQLLSLDVSTSGEDRRDASAANGGFGAFDDPATRDRAGLGRTRRTSTGPEPDSELLPTHAPGTVLELPDGVLVDVLA